MSIALAALLRPFILLVFMLFIVFPISWGLRKLLPDTPLVRLLYDRGLQKQRPALFVVAVILGYGFIALCGFTAFYLISS